MNEDQVLVGDLIPVRAPKNTIRAGVIKKTDETEKMDIHGLPAAVTWEKGGLVRVYVYDAEKDRYVGPYALSSSDVIP